MTSSPPDIHSRHSLTGFYRTPVCKCIISWLGLAHLGMQIPMLGGLQKYFICRFPDVVNKGEWWRLASSKLVCLDTKDAVLALILCYKFRLFERRWGSRRFASRIFLAFILSTILEALAVWAGETYWSDQIDHRSSWLWDSNGLTSLGPLGMIFSLLVPFVLDYPKYPGGGGFRFASISPELFTYVAVINLITTNTNVLACISGMMAGLIIRWNVLWVKTWCNIPSFLSSLSYKVLGQWIESGPPPQGMIGATLEIQRTQEMEAMEQHMIQQQTRAAGMRNMQPHQIPRAQVGQGFAERLVNDMGHGRQWQPNTVPPSEENIRLLMDMGFTRDRVENALRQVNNDVQSATTLLVQGM
ncbi:hypothetical protein TCAL_00675 [Tigriopus californicus]|uniref:UBA domain-containing protein n=1 Tax=Tigriopus californicus TaxID=6832 RepID=A0A553PDZ8_TIGCA|nr:ubiquitin-associated domain-containing protein 2-like [Tigriopus californicus]TRY75902.1 hypothetical protein TCAL_00675 [Tigriopus californicus]